MEKKKEVAKKIAELLESNNIMLRDWEKIKLFIDDTFDRIKSKSNFKCDEVTHKRINSWF